jgi:hypothetical protein
MYDPPSYLWALTIAGIIAMLAASCVVLYAGAARAGLGQRRAALLAGGAAAVLGGWCAASAVIADRGWYHQLIHVTPSGAPISELPLALVPTVGVPLLLAVHITSVSALARARRAPLLAAVRLAAVAE